MSPEWRRFADEQRLVLLAPTFKVNKKEVEAQQGYYYPTLWSGACVEAALAELAKREKVSVDKILVFGMSGGAHFSHRFAAWKPERVKAFVAYSAGWWDPPSPKMKGVPGLVMCGEEDQRVQPTLNYYLEARKLDLPVIWRSYRGTGHEMTPAVQAMSQVFLAHYARSEKDEPWIGDIQTYAVWPIEDKDKVPEPVQCILASKAIAEAWKKE
jgi:dienelactone hydrolase